MIARIVLLALISGTAWAGSETSEATSMPDVATAIARPQAAGCIRSHETCRCYGSGGERITLSPGLCELAVAPSADRLGGGNLDHFEPRAISLPVYEPLRAPQPVRGLGYARAAARAIVGER